jgi:hypothetical protein
LRGYKATKGWDSPTGIGSPDAAILVPKMKNWDNAHTEKEYTGNNYNSHD